MKIARTQASSFDEELFAEVISGISALEGTDSGVPDNLDDVLLGQDATNDAEVQFQRGQEVANMEASLGWQYTVEAFHAMVKEYKQAHEESREDLDILRTHREWKIAEKIVARIIANVHISAQVTLPEVPEQENDERDTLE